MVSNIRHIREITQSIQQREQQLKSSGQKAVVVICTDGESSDGDLIEVMKPLTKLPCMIIVALCTDEVKVVNYWNNIEQQIEIEIDVLNDLTSEAVEVDKLNPWLTYGEPLHRMREWGVHLRIMDLIDEKALGMSQLHKFCSSLFGVAIPSFETDPDLFEFKVNIENVREGNIFCPSTFRFADDFLFIY